jgi:cytoskeletal protein CcmA (bactofilin family)
MSGLQLRSGLPQNKSLIANDLRIMGEGLKIISQSVLQIDGEIDADVCGAEIIVGDQGKVTGLVVGQQVVIRGKVTGVICAKVVALQVPSAVVGDIHHMSFAVERGAMFDGRCRPARNEAELNAVINAKTGGFGSSTISRSDPDCARK